MKILVINPNSSPEMTDSIRAALEAVKRRDTELRVVRTEGAPAAIQSENDVALATPPLLSLVREANSKDYDAVIIACFSDPGLQAAKEVSDTLVLGIAETSLHVAALLGERFTILTPLSSRIPAKRRDVRMYGLESRLASVRALDLSVTETEANPEVTKNRTLEVGAQARDEDGAEVLVLGCAGMVGYAKDIEESLHIAVVDPTTVTLKVCEGLVDADRKTEQMNEGVA